MKTINNRARKIRRARWLLKNMDKKLRQCDVPGKREWMDRKLSEAVQLLTEETFLK